MTEFQNIAIGAVFGLDKNWLKISATQARRYDNDCVYTFHADDLVTE